LAGASNESGAVDDGNFWPFEWLLDDDDDDDDERMYFNVA